VTSYADILWLNISLTLLEPLMALPRTFLSVSNRL